MLRRCSAPATGHVPRVGWGGGATRDRGERAHLARARLVEREQVVERAIVDAAALGVVHVRARHRVRLAAPGLPVREDAHVVPCAHLAQRQRLSSFQHGSFVAHLHECTLHKSQRAGLGCSPGANKTRCQSMLTSVEGMALLEHMVYSIEVRSAYKAHWV